MSEQAKIHYSGDVFISYSDADEDVDWVEDVFAPHLRAKSHLTVITPENFQMGPTRAWNIRRAVEDTHRTILVITPEWLAGDYTNFTGDILIHSDPATRKRKVWPVLLRPAELPVELDRLERIDLTHPRRRNSQMHKLIRSLEDVAPVPPQEQFPSRWEWYWRQARRRGVTPGRVLWAGVVLAAALLLVFTRGPGWERLTSPPNRDRMERLFAANGLLFAASVTETGADSGLWRSTDGGQTWQSIGGFLHLGDIRASVRDFASTETAIYAATRGAGLWRFSADENEWVRVGEDQLPVNLHRMAVGADGERLIVTGIDGGVYLSIDSGDIWRQMDGQRNCADPDGNLPAPIVSGVALVQEGRLLVGSGGDPPLNSGLYASRDGGECWQRVHGAETSGSVRLGNEYLALAALPDGEILVLYRDRDAEQGDPSVHLWALDAAEPIWPSKNGALLRLVVVPSNPPRWYAATLDGTIVSDTVPPSPTGERHFPGPRSCVILLCQAVDFALAADGETPLLLTWRRFYGWGIVPGYRLLWP